MANSDRDLGNSRVMTVKWDKSSFRNILAFWIFGLCNNYGYVIMLSAAEDIMSKQNGNGDGDTSSNSTCLADTVNRECKKASTGAVLLADILPSLIIKLTLPFFVQKIPFGFRHALIVGLQTASYFVVAYSETYAMSLAGVVLAACGSGVGEITYLSLSSHFSPTTISAWSSGTGGAGVVGSFAYAALTEPHMGNLSPKDALLVMLIVPVVFSIAYWFLLDCPDTVYTPSLNPKTWIVPTDHESESSSFSISDKEGPHRGPQGTRTHSPPLGDPPIQPLLLESGKTDHGRVKQRETTFLEKMRLIRPLAKFMIPLSLVYFGEYLINQGLTPLIYFDCDHGFRLSKGSQYRWYQVLYQVGVFISRSSVNIIELPMAVLYLLPVLQLGNAVFFTFDAMYAFVPHISITFVLILIEGLFGGSSYVNTFNYIHKQVDPDVKEFSLSIASTGDSIGIVLAALGGIQLHNWICSYLS